MGKREGGRVDGGNEAVRMRKGGRRSNGEKLNGKE